MKIEFQNITPAMARKWLERVVPFNRPLRPSVIRKYREAYLRGEYVPNHQGIAFDDDGWLMDGQHRLHAIAELPDEMEFLLPVATGLSREAFMTMDQGIKRTTADALRREKRVTQVANLIAYFCHGKAFKLTPAVIEPYVNRIEPTHEYIISMAPKNVKTWSSAPVRAAAIASVFEGIDVDYVATLYRKLVMSEVRNIPLVAEALVRSVANGNARSENVHDFFARCMVMFDPRNSNQVRIQIKDNKKALAILRAQFAFLAPTEPPADPVIKAIDEIVPWPKKPSHPSPPARQ